MQTTKKAFLRSLRRALFWRLPPAETREVLTDYESLFAGGAAEGKTEAELCARFGEPRDAARAIVREEGWRGKRLGVLALVWTALAAFLNWWWTWEFGLGQFLPLLYAFQLALFPVLWLFWRRALTADSPLARRWTGAFWAVPTAVFAAVYGWTVWLLCVYFPRLWGSAGMEENVGPVHSSGQGLNLGQILWTVYELAGLLLIVLVLAILLLCWWDGTVKYLPAASWCVGVHTAFSRQTQAFWRMDPIGSLERMRYEALISPLAALLIVGVGGAALTAVLVRRGGRHGRAA